MVRKMGDGYYSGPSDDEISATGYNGPIPDEPLEQVLLLKRIHQIDKSESNQEQNMSESEPKKSKLAIATLKMPDGKEVEIPLPPKVFKTGREGYYAQIAAFVYDDEVYGGQIQVWKKTPKE